MGLEERRMTAPFAMVKFVAKQHTHPMVWVWPPMVLQLIIMASSALAADFNGECMHRSTQYL